MQALSEPENQVIDLSVPCPAKTSRLADDNSHGYEDEDKLLHKAAQSWKGNVVKSFIHFDVEFQHDLIITFYDIAHQGNLFKYCRNRNKI